MINDVLKIAAMSALETESGSVGTGKYNSIIKNVDAVPMINMYSKACTVS